MDNRTPSAISMQALKRMPAYLQYLKQLRAQGIATISAAKAAQYFPFSEIQVRKDFSSVSRIAGKPRAGFSVSELIDGMETFLGFRNTNEAVLVGTGSLGHALLGYAGFRDYGLKIVAAFDADPAKCNTTIADVPVYPVQDLEKICRRTGVPIGIIAVPHAHAQEVCDQLIASGVRAIWNFAQAQLSVPEQVLVQNENMAGSLAVLVSRLQDTLRREEQNS